MTDVSSFVGSYPYRHLPHATVDWLLGQMDRLGIERAWVGHLPSFLYRDPAPGNGALERLLEGYQDRLSPLPTVNPEQPRWEDDLNRAIEVGAPAVRLIPQFQGIDPIGGEMRVVVAGAAAVKLPVVLTVRLEDLRQRHPLDRAGDLPAAAVRTLVTSDPEVRILVTHADRSFVEEVHFGLTAEEAARVLWDISWIWGPPEDHLALLLKTVGPTRFALGTGMPLRIPDAVFAHLDLLDADEGVRQGILGGNVERWQKGAGGN
ncbi:MAG: hypothetical protein GTN62_14640 [Gemmatimonadales bacterium]|nr:hypothetical protein [Gemmatimonadales bacterium]NIN13322.1 hypothetical protein [Gemmatimonadales bacterium]NIN51325.1 hypothetical protein [Gemmatimonadales bacterium]NIP08789.1 hypothetical protein [Gemmatimonadales bacterium]NIQ99783.1 hypothetical protein [Gemmatimonadales bacterium]